MYLNYPNLAGLFLILFFALVGLKNKDCKFALVVAILSLGFLFIPTEYLYTYSKFLFP